MLNIDVGGSLSLNLMLGKIEASGSFKYIEEKKVKSRYYKEQCSEDYINLQDFGFEDVAVLNFFSQMRTETVDIEMLRQ